MYTPEHELLKKAGLNSSETIMFLALCSLQENAPLKNIISQCGMTEFTGYRTARRLVDKGLAEIYQDAGLKWINPSSMQALVKSVAKEQRKLRRLELNLQDLAVRYNLASDQKKDMTVFEGTDNYADVYDCLPEQCDDQLLIFGAVNNIWKVTGNDFNSSYEISWINRRMKGGTKAVVVENNPADFPGIVKKDTRQLRNTRFFGDSYEPDQVTFLSGGKAWLFETSTRLPRVTVIEHRGLVQQIKKYHGLLWNMSQPSLQPV